MLLLVWSQLLPMLNEAVLVESVNKMKKELTFVVFKVLVPYRNFSCDSHVLHTCEIPKSHANLKSHVFHMGIFSHVKHM